MLIYTTGSVTNENNKFAAIKWQSCPGFSLIELLVVMFIIAVVAAGVGLAVNPAGSSAKRINQQGDRLFAQMQFALDQALLTSTAYGIAIEQTEDDVVLANEYRWQRFDGLDADTREQRWSNTIAPLGGHELSEELVWSIEVEAESLEDSLDKLLAEEDEKNPPVLLFYPDGEMTSFSMEITLSEAALRDNPNAIDQRYKIALDERGQLARYAVGEVEE